MNRGKVKDIAFPDHQEYIYTIDEILKMDSGEFSWIAEDFIAENGITLLSAPPASFKTWLSLELGSCISRGIPFLGRKTKASNVLYIDKENQKQVQQIYLKKLGLTGNPSLSIWPQWANKVPPPAFPDSLYVKLAKQYKPVMIFDSLIRFFGKDINENTATDMSKVFTFLRSLTNAGATILVLHHSGKSEGSEYRGSSDIKGAVDLAYTIKREDNRTLILKCIKSRYNEEVDIKVGIVSDQSRLIFEDISDELASEAAEEENIKLSNIRSIIMNLEKPTQSEIVKAAKKKLTLSRKPILSLLKKGTGHYWTSENCGKGKPTYYQALSL